MENKEPDMTVVQKLMAVQNSNEVQGAFSLMVAAFLDCDLKSHLRFTYETKAGFFELTLLPVKQVVEHELHNITLTVKPEPPVKS